MTKKEINNLAKGYKEAEIYFHIDLDGVLSAMVMIEYLKTINVKTTAVHPIQYGPREYSIPKPDLNKLQILVDFNSGKPYMNIHTDHHDKQTGFIDTALTSFEINRSNATTLNKILFDDKLLSKLDSFVVDTIDSADYARWNITPTDVIQPIDGEKYINYKDRVKYLKFGLLVNKLLLSFKNKLDFMKTVVLDSDCNLKSIYSTITNYISDNKLADMNEISTNGKVYADAQKLSENSFMKGHNAMIYGLAGSARNSGSYDRYTLFKNYPDSNYAIVCWPMGLIQISKNPFKKEYNPHILSDIAWKVLNKYKSELSRPVSLGYMKLINELNLNAKTGAGKNAIGFTFEDAYNRYKPIIEFKIYTKLTEENNTVDTIDTIKARLSELMIKHWDELTEDEQLELNEIKIPLWDIIKSSSGGHKDITNISNLNLLGKEYISTLKKIWMDIGTEMETKVLLDYNNPTQENIDLPCINVPKAIITDFTKNMEFVMIAEPFNNIKIKLLDKFINKYNGISWNIKFGDERTSIWNGTLQAWLQSGLINNINNYNISIETKNISNDIAPMNVPVSSESTPFDNRLEYGKDAEAAVLKDLQLRNIQATAASIIPGWSAEKDLKYGDIYVKNANNTIYIDVKRGRTQNGDLIGSVSERSKDDFAGDYYVFTNGISVTGAKVLKARSVKAYMNKVRNLDTLPSGDKGWKFNLDKMKTAIAYEDWLNLIRN